MGNSLFNSPGFLCASPHITLSPLIGCLNVHPANEPGRCDCGGLCTAIWRADFRVNARIPHRSLICGTESSGMAFALEASEPFVNSQDIPMSFDHQLLADLIFF